MSNKERSMKVKFIGLCILTMFCTLVISIPVIADQEDITAVEDSAFVDRMRPRVMIGF